MAGANRHLCKWNMGYETRIRISEFVVMWYLSIKLSAIKDKQRHGKMKCLQPDCIHKYKITDVVNCSVWKGGTIVEQRKASDVINTNKKPLKVNEEIIKPEGTNKTNLIFDCGDLLNVFLSASIYSIFSVLNYNKKTDYLYRCCIFRCAIS
jgi:hypothetical protein